MLDLQTLRGLAAMCASRSDFYAKRLPRQIDSWDAWREVPLISKEDILSLPFESRSLSPIRESDWIGASSGTSGTPPLFLPRSHVKGFEYRWSSGYGRSLLSSIGPPHRQEIFFEEHGEEPRVVCLDPKRIEGSVRLAKAAGVDSMFVFPFLIAQVGEAMGQIGTCSNIRFIELGGEVPTLALLQYIEKTFPNARISGQYGAADIEASPIAYTCQPMTTQNVDALYHAWGDVYFELIDPDTTTPQRWAHGSEGELVVSASAEGPYAFPLLRYRLGDLVRVGAPCEAHGEWTFTILGRAQLDTLKIVGGILRADEITRVLKKHKDITDVFELHHFLRQTAAGPKSEFRLDIEPRGSVDLSALALDLAREIRVAPSFALADGIRQGLYLPLQCGILAQSASKRKRIVRH